MENVDPKELNKCSCYWQVRLTRYWRCQKVQLQQNLTTWILCLLDLASLWQLKNKKPTWCHLLFYFTSYVLNLFRTLIYLSSGSCDYSVELPHWSIVMKSNFGISLVEDQPHAPLGTTILFLVHVCWSFGYHSNPTTPKLQHTSNQEQYDQCGNSTEWSQAPDNGYINVRNKLST